MNKRKYYIIALFMLVFILTLSGTVAYYNYSMQGLLKANTANYTLNISGESISNQSINLGNNLKS